MVDLVEFAQRKHGEEFMVQVNSIAEKLKINPLWLLFVMYSESQMVHFAISDTNTDGSKDYGLIQFNDRATIPNFGITPAQLISLTANEQMYYVYEYYKPIAGKVKRLGDLYLYNFSPHYFINEPNHPTATGFKNIVEKKYTALTGYSPTDKSNITTTKNNITTAFIGVAIFALIFLLFNTTQTQTT